MPGWETVESTGLLDDCDITITKAEFNYDAQYDNGETLIMIMEGTSNHEAYEDFTQFFSIGAGWDTEDNGATVVGKDAFNSNSQYARFFLAAIDLAGDALTGRGFPDNASIWTGLKFHVNRATVDYGGEIGEKQVLLPTAFLGVDSGKAEAPAPAATPEPTGASNGTNAALRAKLMATAMASSDHDAFLETVMEKYPEVQEDDDLFAAIVDETGFYAEHG